MQMASFYGVGMYLYLSTAPSGRPLILAASM